MIHLHALLLERKRLLLESGAYRIIYGISLHIISVFIVNNYSRLMQLIEKIFSYCWTFYIVVLSTTHLSTAHWVLKAHLWRLSLNFKFSYFLLMLFNKLFLRLVLFHHISLELVKNVNEFGLKFFIYLFDFLEICLMFTILSFELIELFLCRCQFIFYLICFLLFFFVLIAFILPLFDELIVQACHDKLIAEVVFNWQAIRAKNSKLSRTTIIWIKFTLFASTLATLFTFFCMDVDLYKSWVLWITMLTYARTFPWIERHRRA